MPDVSIPLVSVIIPTVRDDTYFGEALNSVMNDKYPNKEVIVIWDGPEGSGSSAEVEGVRYIYTGGVRAPGANSAGLDAARGEFIAMLDGVAISVGGRLPLQVESLRSNPKAPSCVSVLQALDNSDIHVHSALYDDFPMSGPDAAARGLTVLWHRSRAFDGLGVALVDTPSKAATAMAEHAARLTEETKTIRERMPPEAIESSLRKLYRTEDGDAGRR